MESGFQMTMGDNGLEDSRYYSDDLFGIDSRDFSDGASSDSDCADWRSQALPGKVDVMSGMGAIDAETMHLPEGPMKHLPQMFWREIVTHLLTTETMSLRCTARVVFRHLEQVTDAIIDGCRIVDQATLGGIFDVTSAPVLLDNLMTLRLETRCSLLRRYAKQGGMARLEASGPSGTGKSEPIHQRKLRYFTRHALTSGSRLENSVRAWRWAVAMTKAELHEARYDVSGSVALSELFAAEMYAPLARVVANPAEHMRRVVNEAYSTLSMPRWIDFLHATQDLRTICNPIARAYRALSASIDSRFPLPRLAVIASIVHASMTSPRGKQLRAICLNRIGLSPECLNDQIVPRVTDAIVESILLDPFLRGMDVPYRLLQLAERWDSNDGVFAASLHRSFLSGLAKNVFCSVQTWKSLSRPFQDALCTRVLGIAPHDALTNQYNALTIVAFWGLYFEVTSPTNRMRLPDVAWKIDALPWPLQATLWRLAAEVHADPHRTRRGTASVSFEAHLMERLDRLCTHALNTDAPHYALPALQASLKCQVARACLDLSPPFPMGEAAQHGRDPQCPVFSQAAWSVFERCSIEERLPFVAALFSQREAVRLCGYKWLYESLIAEDVVTFLCDPTSTLVLPSREIVQLLLHHLPLCGGRLPEAVLGRDHWETALAKRFGVPPEDLTLPLGRDRHWFRS
ncbi:hypothetical protein [Robbsia sp. KACC 23696]|uniref:hypothetical protein n=1 Tax=Robbsia sp. KACC 23696 TaxID=3149231 RepID=UPI00325AEFF8